MNRLQQIIDHKQAEVAMRRCARPEALLMEALTETRKRDEALGSASPFAERSLHRALLRAEFPLIAEFKRRSPSAGAIAPKAFEPVEVAQGYVRSGAAAISVLTDERFFEGHLKDLEHIRSAVSLPLLRKDFIIDTYQLPEALLNGADAVLLIAECLDDQTLLKLYDRSLELGLEVLLEVHHPDQLKRLPSDAAMVGINHRDLSDFSVDIRRGPERLPALRRACPNALAIAESGLESADDAAMLLNAGFDALLVGSLFMRSADPALACADFFSRLKLLQT